MTVRSAAPAALLLLAMACAGSREHVLAFDPGEHTARVRDLRIDVVQARYAERQLTVQCAVQNEGDSPVTIDREGVLLDDDGLEIPPAALAGQPGRITVEPGGSSVLVFSFSVGGTLPRTRTLGLWIVEREGGSLPPIRVNVPGIRTEPA